MQCRLILNAYIRTVLLVDVSIKSPVLSLFTFSCKQQWLGLIMYVLIQINVFVLHRGNIKVNRELNLHCKRSSWPYLTSSEHSPCNQPNEIVAYFNSY